MLSKLQKRNHMHYRILVIFNAPGYLCFFKLNSSSIAERQTGFAFQIQKRKSNEKLNWLLILWMDFALQISGRKKLHLLI